MLYCFAVTALLLADALGDAASIVDDVVITSDC